MSAKPIAVTGLGNAIMDVLTSAEDAVIEQLNMPKGVMRLIEEDEAQTIHAAMGEAVEKPGGSAANTIAGLAELGVATGFMGRTQDDETGRAYRAGMEADGIKFASPAASDGPATGRCLIFVTPDAHRTMNTYLGAGGNFCPADLDHSLIEQSAITYLEGYLFDAAPAKQAFRDAMKTAKDAGGKVALTLSDPFCVERHRDDFLELVSGQVDYLFANEEEAKMLFAQDDFDAIVEEARKHVDVVIITRSEKGASLARDGKVVHVDANPLGDVVDTTGAGDQFAAGVLFGLHQGYDLERAGKIGSVCAGEVISHFGPRPEQPVIELLKAQGLV